MTRRIENPHYGMVVTDGIAGRVFMLIHQAHPHLLGARQLVWRAVRLDADPPDWTGRDYQLLLDSNQFGEVTE